MLSVICIVNNSYIYHQYLYKSLKMYGDVEKIIIYNYYNTFFKSAAQAYNSIINKTRGEYLMFVHQDVFLRKGWKENIEGLLSTLPNSCGIVGVAGALFPMKPFFRTYLEYLSLKLFNLPSLWYKRYVCSSCFHIKSKTPFGSIITEPVKVQTVDEMLFIIPRKIFDEQRFDEEACSGWHLYAVDFSLSVMEKGYHVYVIPVLVYHLSRGLINKDYVESARKVANKHKAVGLINTTMGPLPTPEPYLGLHLYFIKRYVNL